LRGVFDGQPIDVAVLAMAVSDFEPEPYAGKVSSDAESLDVRCRPTPKVIRSVRDWAPAVYLVGFKLLSGASREELIRRGEDACRVNRADLTVANDLQALRQGRHALHLVRPEAEPETLEPGEDLADRLVARILAWAGEMRSNSSTPSA
jgi:phosphopantothenate-cysteine ligase